LKVGVGIGIGVAVGIIAVIFGTGMIGKSTTSEQASLATNKPASNEVMPTDTNTPPASSDSDMKEVELASLLPTREDIGTEWLIRPVNQSSPLIFHTNSEFIWYIETITQFFEDPSSMGGGITVRLYSFESEDSAVKAYEKLVSDLRTEGGYKEVDVSDIDATCYGTDRARGSGETDVYCSNSNLNFIVTSIPTDNENTISFAKLIAGKFVL
jgi:hypothetical protein